MMLPHPVHVIMNLEQRHADFLAESAREQRALLAERGSSPRSRTRWLDLLATLTVLVVFALLVAAGATALMSPSPAVALVASIALS